jgi:flagellar basal-body rod modification protein FlgD
MDATSAATSAIASATSAAASSANAAAANATAPSTKDNGLSADFNTFLKLLTAQLRNQDPLNPSDSTEFVAQLAQFSGVEQQVQTNTKLNSILEALSATSTGALADWLGREVRAPAAAPFTGEPVDVFPPSAPVDATNAVLIVRDASGAVIDEQPFTPGATSLTWDGRLESGETAEPGNYRFEARFGLPQEATTTIDAEVFSRVIEARREGGEAILTVGGGVSVLADDVTAVRGG